MLVVKFIVKHQIIVSDIETSSKMVSTLRQKWLVNICQKAQNIVQFGLYDLVEISPVGGPKTYQVNVWRDFKLQQLIK